jgi:hypothetical protein
LQHILFAYQLSVDHGEARSHFCNLFLISFTSSCNTCFVPYFYLKEFPKL